VVCICIEKQKVVWILKLRDNGWEATTSALRYSIDLMYSQVYESFAI
jgi:hypothetical protein